MPTSGQGDGVSLSEGESLEKHTIAEGQTPEGVAWRLFTWSTGKSELLCLEQEGTFSPWPCTGRMGIWPEGTKLLSEGEAMGPPKATGTSPAFVFGALRSGTARVAVELEGRRSVEAEIVGERSLYYVAVLPQGARPLRVVTYSPEGEEIARRDLRGNGQIDEGPPQRQCRETPEGFACASGGGGTSFYFEGTIRCYDEDGQTVCEEVE